MRHILLVQQLMGMEPASCGFFYGNGEFCFAGNWKYHFRSLSFSNLAADKLTIIHTVPSLAFDMAGAILSVPAIEFGKLGDKALVD